MADRPPKKRRNLQSGSSSSAIPESQRFELKSIREQEPARPAIKEDLKTRKSLRSGIAELQLGLLILTPSSTYQALPSWDSVIPE
jgi:hypothetical protein